MSGLCSDCFKLKAFSRWILLLRSHRKCSLLCFAVVLNTCHQNVTESTRTDFLRFIPFLNVTREYHQQLETLYRYSTDVSLDLSAGQFIPLISYCLGECQLTPALNRKWAHRLVFPPLFGSHSISLFVSVSCDGQRDQICRWTNAGKISLMKYQVAISLFIQNGTLANSV